MDQNAMAARIELWPLSKLQPYERNARTHDAAQVQEIAASIKRFGFLAPILVNEKTCRILAGHGRLEAAKLLGLEVVPVVPLDHLTDEEQRAYILADNKIAENAGWDNKLLAAELKALDEAGFDVALTGFSEAELKQIYALDDLTGGRPQQRRDDVTPSEPPLAVTRPGDVWQVGRHRIVCGDSRNLETVKLALEDVPANLIFTSPPYADKRTYDKSTEFRAVPPDEYVEWFKPFAANLQAMLAEDGSYFLNIKEHAEDGERVLYVKDLVIAHKREWGWRFVDELCWRKTDNGLPGGWEIRFKNAWEPVFHFCRAKDIKFNSLAAGHLSENCFDYSVANTRNRGNGSMFLSKGPRGKAAEEAWREDESLHEGVARPSNVIELPSESGQGKHAAPFPRALAEFFIKCFSDPGDTVFDPFLGSGTTIAAAEELDRAGAGVEISPVYCDMAVRRIEAFSEAPAVLVETGETFLETAARRKVTLADLENAPSVSAKPRRKPVLAGEENLRGKRK